MLQAKASKHVFSAEGDVSIDEAWLPLPPIERIKELEKYDLCRSSDTSKSPGSPVYKKFCITDHVEQLLCKRLCGLMYVMYVRDVDSVDVYNIDKVVVADVDDVYDVDEGDIDDAEDVCGVDVDDVDDAKDLEEMYEMQCCRRCR